MKNPSKEVAGCFPIRPSFLLIVLTRRLHVKFKGTYEKLQNYIFETWHHNKYEPNLTDLRMGVLIVFPDGINKHVVIS